MSKEGYLSNVKRSLSRVWTMEGLPRTPEMFGKHGTAPVFRAWTDPDIAEFLEMVAEDYDRGFRPGFEFHAGAVYALWMMAWASKTLKSGQDKS